MPLFIRFFRLDIKTVLDGVVFFFILFQFIFLIVYQNCFTKSEIVSSKTNIISYLYGIFDTISPVVDLSLCLRSIRRKVREIIDHCCLKLFASIS